MSVEEKLKDLLGEQAFRIAILAAQLDEAQEKIKQLSNGKEQTPDETK